MPDVQINNRLHIVEEALASFIQTVKELSREARKRSQEADERSRMADERSRMADERIEEVSREAKRWSQEADKRIEKARLDAAAEANRLRADAAAEANRLRADAATEANRLRGDLSNRLGTLAEDMVVPSVPTILQQIAGCKESEIDLVAARMKRSHITQPGLNQEIDVFATTNKLALIVEVRSKLRPEYIEEVIEKLSKVRDYFGRDICERSIVCAVATLYPDPSVVRHAEGYGLIVLGLGRDLMEIKNSKNFKPKFF